jgi:hypothetical protein
MAKVWFVRRRGGVWIAPGGVPFRERPLADLIFPLDLGTHRLLGERVTPTPELPADDPAKLEKVFVEVVAEDLRGYEFSGYQQGFYDSPYSPAVVARKLG